ncbi:Putative phosphatase YfbT [Caenispirillum salinarum AK4]|uniref:Putative phosphatase YfbT n=1 Tax=Caenispirillum salinarum AK4 TaxID=1238182 RepID=K9HRH5_9PROT|nr:HAD-IA family hydrolase [Caenispirillum salinarum]EKV32898.1 Putative phosphatase YfbT [Caenispirillum salinarum AK4]
MTAEAAFPPLMAEALLLDFDGVLFDTSASVDLFWRRFAENAGLPAEQVLADVHGRREVDTIRALAPDRVTSDATYYRDRPILPEEIEWAREYTGAVDLLRTLAPERFAIVTSGHRALLKARLAHFGLELPRVTVTADDVSDGKPSPAPYRLAAERLGVNAARAVVIEDAPPGITAGKAAGARVIAVTTTHAAAELGEADRIVPDLGALAVSALEDGTIRIARRTP